MSVNDLNRNQKRAIAALIEHRSIAAAAEAIGLNPRTLTRYLEEPEFRTALNQAEADTIDGAGRRLLAGQEQALDTLEELIKGAENESTRRLAAVAWMDLALRWRELRNVEQRIADLEAAVYGR